MTSPPRVVVLGNHANPIASVVLALPGIGDYAEKNAYVGAVVFVASGIDASPGDVLLVLAAGSRLSSYVGATVGEIGFLRGFWMDGSRRLAWLDATLDRAMDALRLALGGEGFQVAPCSRLADGELCHNFGDTQSSLLRKQEKDLLLTLGSGDEISHKQSKSLTNNHSTFF